MLFLQTGCNSVGTPEGYIQLEPGETIHDLVSLRQCKWKQVNKECLDVKNLYRVITGDTGFGVVLVPGFIGMTPGGERICCVSLGDSFFNGNFVCTGSREDRKYSKWLDPEIYEKVWGKEWDRTIPWYKRAWQCRNEGVAI